MKIFFERFWKIKKIQKVTFSKIFENQKINFVFQKVNFFWKSQQFSIFHFFWKSDFLKFSIFQNRSNIFSIKNQIFRKKFIVIFLSYLMYYLIKWHRGTPTVPPVGAVNDPAENPKIQKIHIFEDFWEHFFLINHIGFSLKHVIPKSSTDFFSSKK